MSSSPNAAAMSDNTFIAPADTPREKHHPGVLNLRRYAGQRIRLKHAAEGWERWITVGEIDDDHPASITVYVGDRLAQRHHRLAQHAGESPETHPELLPVRIARGERSDFWFDEARSPSRASHASHASPAPEATDDPEEDRPDLRLYFNGLHYYQDKPEAVLGIRCAPQVRIDREERVT